MPTHPPANDAQRLINYRSYLDFYNGQHWDTLPAPNERRLTLNYARIFIHKAASYLMGKGVTFAVEPPNNPAPEAAQTSSHAETLLQSAYHHNSLALLDLDTAVDTAVLGDGAFRVTWDPAANAPLVTAVDPATITCTRKPDDYRTLLSVSQTYPAGISNQGSGISPNPTSPPDPYAVGSMQYADSPTSTITEKWASSTLEIYHNNQLIERTPNPYGFIPYVIFPNLRIPKEPWGQSDLADILAINRDLNSRLSVLSHILEVSGNPIAVLENVTDSTNIKVGPGRLWELPKDARAYLLDLLSGNSVTLHIEYINLLYRAMHDLAEMPRTAFGDGAGTTRSGVALEIEMQPLLQKVARKRAIWTTALEQRSRMILQLYALHDDPHAQTIIAPNSGYTIRVVWPPILPSDRTELVQQETALVAARIHSRRRALDLLGEPDSQSEWQRVQEEETQNANRET